MRPRGLLLIGGLGLLASCGRASSSTAAAPLAAAAPAPIAAPAWQARAAGGQTPIDPGIGLGPATSAEQLALLDAESCRACHADQHAEWAQSRHALAWTNGIFQREYRAQPRAWCVNCHAPLTVQQEAMASGDARLADQGVSCAACHVRRGQLVSSGRGARSPHRTVVDASFASPAMCADCHQFTFPVMTPVRGEVLRMTAHPMQTTVRDFLDGPYADAPGGCLACHGSRAGHAFPGGHDLELLRSAIEASWCRRDGGPAGEAGAEPTAKPTEKPTAEPSVVMEVANVGAGHRVPTGDIHRHMVARFWRSSAPEATFEAFFGRRYQPAPDGGKRITWDSTLAPGQRRRFEVKEAALRSPSLSEADLLQGAADEVLAEPINFEVTYVYTIDEFPRSDRAPSEPVTQILLSERKRLGELPRCAPVEPQGGAASQRRPAQPPRRL